MILHNIQIENAFNYFLKRRFIAVGPFSRNKSYIYIYIYIVWGKTKVNLQLMHKGNYSKLDENLSNIFFHFWQINITPKSLSKVFFKNHNDATRKNEA